MKKIKVFAVLVFLFFSIASHAQVENRDTLIQRIYLSLKNNDEKAFMKLFPSYEQIKLIVNDMIVNIKDSATKAMMSKAFLQINETMYAEKISKDMAVRFRETIQKGKDKNINWSEILYSGSELKEEKIPEFAEKQ